MFKDKKGIFNPGDRTPADAVPGDRIDGDIEAAEVKTAQPIAGGVSAEEYDRINPPERDEALEAEIQQEDGIHVEYSYTGEDVIEGLTVFQKATIFKKNMIYSGILILIIAAYIINYARMSNQTLSMFLAVVSIAVLGIIWIMPKMHIKKIAKFTDEQKMEFSMTIYDTCVKVGEDGGSFLLSFDKKITHVFETVNLFLICAGKEQIFILPKRCLHPQGGDDVEAEVRESLKASMKKYGKPYIDKSR